MPPAIQLVAGLGNPGAQYQATRHNAGFWLADRMAGDGHARFQNENKFHGDICRIQDGDLDYRIVKPATFMNLSGQAVTALAHFYRIPIETILVIHDEVDLEPGVVRLKQGGGHGGHNGLRDIIDRLGENGFYRLRIGVGHPGSKDLVTPYVLGKPGQADRSAIDEAIDRAMTVMPLILRGEFQRAMNELHRSINNDPDKE